MLLHQRQLFLRRQPATAFQQMILGGELGRQSTATSVVVPLSGVGDRASDGRQERGQLSVYTKLRYLLECTWEQCCGSGMFIPDPGSDFFPSRIPDPNYLHPGSRILIKELDFKYFNPIRTKKIVSKL